MTPSHSLEHAIALLPGSWQGYHEMSLALLGKRDYTAALRHIENACSLAPKSYLFFACRRPLSSSA